MKKKNRLSAFSIIMVFACLVIIGVGFLPLLNVQLNPSNASANLNIHYQWPDASARIVEQEVTSILEGLFSSVKGVKDINSESAKGSGYINITFKDNVNIDAARFEISNLVRQAYPNFPPRVSYPFISLNAQGKNNRPVLTYTLSASSSPHYIQKLAEDHILPALTKIKGVADVHVYGAAPFEWEITYSVKDIRNLGISASDIISGVNGYFRHENLGKVNFVDYRNKTVSETSAILAFQSKDSLDWSAIPIKKVGERIVYLEDIAEVRYKEQRPSAYFRINGLNTINMVVFASPDVNTIPVADEVNHMLSAQIKKQVPAGFNIIKSYDATEFLKDELHKIFQRTIFSLGILLLFVFITSRQYKYLLLILFSIVANLAIAAIWYYFLGVEIHLYSLAGITISFGIVIDNSIVMIDHLRHHRNKNVFLAILGATLTTIGALCIVFFLDEQQRSNLLDFALVIIINLTISMAIALFLIPAMMEKVPLPVKINRHYFKRRRNTVKVSRVYAGFIHFSKRWKWAFVFLLLLGFGIPIGWLPEKIEKDTLWAGIYNSTLGADSFKEDIKPHLEKYMGGSLRLFINDVFENASYSEPSKTTLNVRGVMPEGCTVQQLNEAVEKMENFISKFEEVEMFQTSIYSYNNSTINIYFKEDHEFGGFPYFLKSELESKAIGLGGLDWSVWGVGRGFSNALHSGFKSNRITLEGYNYEQLYDYADLLKKNLLENSRIKEVDIAGNFDWNAKILQEYHLEFDNEKLALYGVNMTDFYSYLKDRVYRQNLRPVYTEAEMQSVVLRSDEYEQFNVWSLKNEPIAIGEDLYKLGQFGQITKQKTGNSIYKSNQQYRLTLAFDFIGPYQLAKMVQEEHTDKLKAILPLGYTVEADNNGGWWDKKEEEQYYLIVLVVAIIYFICAILFESLVQPLVIITLIPISFIGVFLTFYLFEINFDQGGYASFIMLCGLAVNAGLFIINDYNNNLKRSLGRSRIELYLKAFNYKIVPIMLTIVSTVIGLIPFVWEGQNEVFWYAFAVGVIGGLTFSLVAIFVYLPLFLRLKK